MSPARSTDRFRSRQAPVEDEVFLDHTAHFVQDLDQAGTRLQRLGFRPSAINLQTNLGEDGLTRPSGTSNKLVRLRRGFLEFLAATHDTPLADQLRKAHARHEGVHLLAFSHADLEAQRSRLVTSGFRMQPMVHMRRHSSESGGVVAWSILRTQPGEMPEGRIQFVFPHTPELSWPPGSTEHPNQVDSLTGVMICVNDPDEAAERYGSFLGRKAEDHKFSLDRGLVKIVSPMQAGAILSGLVVPGLPFIGAVTVATADLDETRRILRENGVSPMAEADSVLWVGPRDALGCYIGFHDHRCTPM